MNPCLLLIVLIIIAIILFLVQTYLIAKDSMKSILKERYDKLAYQFGINYYYDLTLNSQKGHCTKMYIEHKDKKAYIFNTTLDIKQSNNRVCFDYRSGYYRGYGFIVNKTNNNGLYDYEIDIKSYNCTQSY